MPPPSLFSFFFPSCPQFLLSFSLLARFLFCPFIPYFRMLLSYSLYLSLYSLALSSVSPLPRTPEAPSRFFRFYPFLFFCPLSLFLCFFLFVRSLFLLFFWPFCFFLSFFTANSPLSSFLLFVFLFSQFSKASKCLVTYLLPLHVVSIKWGHLFYLHALTLVQHSPNTLV